MQASRADNNADRYRLISCMDYGSQLIKAKLSGRLS